jgi:UDP-2,3-diacylglucosamine pyrophosphatase LpxH
MIPSGQIFLIGDSHIGLADGDEKKIVDWIERLSVFAPRALYLNGDVFHYLIGHRNFFTSSVEKFLAKLKWLRERGCEVYYVEGNRDFFIKGSVAEASVTRVSTNEEFLAGSKRYFVIHGDMINDKDLPYRFWRVASKNRFTKFAVGLVPKNLARTFVDRVEKKLARSNFKHKTRLPVELMEAYGRKRKQDGFDVVVFGHFHHKLLVPAGDAMVAVLPAWYESGEALMVDPASGDYQYVMV